MTLYYYCYKILLRLIDVVKSAVLCGRCNFVKQQLWLEFTNFVQKSWDFFHHKQVKYDSVRHSVIFWSETVKTNVSTKKYVIQICLMIFGQNLEIPIIVQQSQKSKVSLVMTIIKESYVQCRFSPQLLDKCW